MSGHDHSHESENLPPLEGAGGPALENLVLEEAIRELLIEKEVIEAREVERLLEVLQTRRPALGARLVTRIWTDPDFRKLALENGKAAAELELGINLVEAPEIIFLENTPKRHHIVVCTLCSCYPTYIMGPSPTWYRSKAFRARVVKEPRAVLAEFNTDLPEDVEIRVVDSTAEVRYLVVPVRPGGSEGMNREALARLVNRDSMIGAALADSP